MMRNHRASPAALDRRSRRSRRFRRRRLRLRQRRPVRRGAWRARLCVRPRRPPRPAPARSARPPPFRPLRRDRRHRTPQRRAAAVPGRRAAEVGADELRIGRGAGAASERLAAMTDASRPAARAGAESAPLPAARTSQLRHRPARPPRRRRRPRMASIASTALPRSRPRAMPKRICSPVSQGLSAEQAAEIRKAPSPRPPPRAARSRSGSTAAQPRRRRRRATASTSTSRRSLRENDTMKHRPETRPRRRGPPARRSGRSGASPIPMPTARTTARRWSGSSSSTTARTASIHGRRARPPVRDHPRRQRRRASCRRRPRPALRDARSRALIDCEGGEKIVDESRRGRQEDQGLICTKGGRHAATAERLEEALARIRANDQLSDEQKARIETALRSAIDRARSAP